MASRELLDDIATAQRERAVAEARSKRLTLEGIHDAYQMEGSREAFVRAHRNHALADIQEAERRIRRYACRCHIRCCDRYFAAVLRGVAGSARAQRATQRGQRILQRQQSEALQRFRDDETAIANAPATLLQRGLDRLAAQWSDTLGALVAGGAGIGRADLRNACEAIGRTAPLPDDAIEAAWRTWRSNASLRSEVIDAVRRVLDTVRNDRLSSLRNSTSTARNPILRPQHNSRPPPPSGLRN